MVINYDNYKNDGWGLSKLGFEQLFEQIKNNPKNTICVLEFGSGISTKFFSDLSKILNKKIQVTSFDNSFEYMYKEKSDPDVVVNLRELEETDDAKFNQMFDEKAYNKSYMHCKTSTHLKNQFYVLDVNDLSGIYDYMLLDGPHGNGRSLAFLHANGHLNHDSVVFIDDFTHYDFVDKFLKIFDAEELFRNIGGKKNKWEFGGDFIIFKIKKYIMENIDVIDFRFAEATDKFNVKYEAWSRIYEYEYVLDFIKWNMYKGMEKPKIHNTSWGFEGVHVIFRDDLDLIGECVHSDIVHSNQRETYFYDITTENKVFENKFDFVLNVSTIEHLNIAKERVLAIQNLFKQVKNGGYLILTFDYPRVNLLEIESLVNSKCKEPINPLNGKNSFCQNMNYKNLNIVYLILRKK
jgi:SAM-dependent methyltransferase